MKIRAQQSVIVRTGALAGAAVLATLALLALLPAPPPAAAAAPPPLRVLAPQPGQKLPTGPLWVKVRLRHGAHGLRATLNGQATGHFLRRRHGLRLLQVSPSHGLRFGRNLLRFSVRRHGRRVKAGSLGFRIGAGRPLAAAGLDVTTAPGDTIRLDGGDSVAHPSAPGGPRALRYRWRIVSRDGHPTGAAASAAAPEMAQLRDPDSLEPVLEPVGAEAVTVKLTVTAPDGRSGSDLLSVRVDPPPSVRLETTAKQGNDYGIRLSGPVDEFYKADPGKWLQVVVLKRSNLELVSNTSYDCPAATQHPFNAAAELGPCASRVHAALEKLKDKAHSNLVIVASQPGPDPAAQPPAGVGRALAGFVRVWSWWSSSAKVQRGAYAAVFVPGLPNETVDNPSADQGPGATIVGNLVRNNEGVYELTPSERAAYRVNAPGTDATHNVIEVGGKRYEQAIPAGSKGGFQIVVVDARTLSGESRWFETGGKPAGVTAMNSYLTSAVEQKSGPFKPAYMVFVASHGDPSFSLAGADVAASRGNAEALRELLAKLGGMGATPVKLAATLDSRKAAGNGYILVGRSAVGQGRGEETTGKGQQTASGTLARTSITYQYEVQPEAAPADGPDARVGSARLIEVLEQAPTAWPEQGDAGKTAAVRYIGEQVLGTDNPRSQYWTRPYDAASWDKVASSIKALAFADGKGFTAADLNWAQAELAKEIGWLENTYAYLGALAKPFSDNGLKSWATLQQVADKVQKDVQASGRERAKAQADVIWDLALTIAGHAPVIGEAVDLGAGIYHYATGLADLDGAPADDDFSSAVAEIGKRLADRLQAAQAMLLRQFPDVAAADYGRLRILGACTAPVVSERAACPQDPGAWQFTQDDQAKVAKTVEEAAEASAYAAVVPAKYTLFELPVDYPTKANIYVGGTLVGAVCWRPFGDLPANGQIARPIYGPPPYNYRATNFDTYQVMAMGQMSGSGTITDKYKMALPGEGLINHLFGDGTDDLGLDRDLFFYRYFDKLSKLDHYPEKDTPTGWSNVKCPINEGGAPLGAPPSVGVGRAYRAGIPVSFTVPPGGPATAELTLSLGTAKPRRAQRGEPLRDGAILTRVRFRAAEPGQNQVGLQVPRRFVKRVLASRYRRATLRLRLSSAGGQRSATRTTIELSG